MESKKFLIFLLISIIKLILSEELKDEGRKLYKQINLPKFHNFHDQNEQKHDETLIETKNLPRHYDNTREDDIDRDEILIKPKKPLKNIFMGIYKNYKATYLGNRTSSEYRKSLSDTINDEDVIETKKIKNYSNEIIDNESKRKINKKKKKKKKNKNKKNKGSVTKKDEALLYSYDGEYRYNIGPGVNVSLDMKQDIVNVNLDEDNIKDILLRTWDDFDDSNKGIQGRGRGKKYEMITKILPLFILPFLIQSAIIPFLVTKLKLLLINSILIGKLAIFLIIISALKNQHKSQAYEPSPAYWASEPSRRSEPYNGYRVEGRPTTWIN